jgi:hypothetical protein
MTESSPLHPEKTRSIAKIRIETCIDAIIAETVMKARGLHVRFFFDEAMTIEWLMAG